MAGLGPLSVSAPTLCQLQKLLLWPHGAALIERPAMGLAGLGVGGCQKPWVSSAYSPTHDQTCTPWTKEGATGAPGLGVAAMGPRSLGGTHWQGRALS